MNENKVDPKEIEKVQKLLCDEEFVKKLISQETIEDAKKLFEDQGIATSIEEMEMLGRFIKKISEKGNKKLSEEELTEIVGGVNLKNVTIRIGGTVIGICVGAIVGVVGGSIIGSSSIAMGIVAVSPPKFDDTKKMTLLNGYVGAIGGSVLGIIAGTITGAIKGYKIAGKWCD